jgi:hypothetical protein
VAPHGNNVCKRQIERFMTYSIQRNRNTGRKEKSETNKIIHLWTKYIRIHVSVACMVPMDSVFSSIRNCSSLIYLFVVYLKAKLITRSIRRRINVVMCMCDCRRGLDWWLDLLTTYTHNSELQVITGPPLSFFLVCCVFTSRSLVTSPNSRHSSASALKSCLHSLP